MTQNGYSLLIVDGTPSSREALRSQLSHEGYHVHEASSGPEALELLRNRMFDLVLLEIEMPGMNGREVLRALRQSHSLTDLPIIVVTDRDRTDDMVATLQLGANDYVTKPYNFPVILARLQT